MSARQTERLESVNYGVREFDLSTDRATEDTFELIRLPDARSLTPLDVPAECYLRFGDPTAPAVDLREHVGQEFTAKEGRTFGAVYLENPTGVTGTLRLFYGSEIGVAGNPEIGEVSAVNGTVSVSDPDGPQSDSTTSTGTNVSVTHADGPVGIVVEASGAGVLTVGVSHDGGTTWTSYDLDYTTDGLRETVHGFTDVRAAASANLTRLSIAAKGVGG